MQYRASVKQIITVINKKNGKNEKDTLERAFIRYQLPVLLSDGSLTALEKALIISSSGETEASSAGKQLAEG